MSEKPQNSTKKREKPVPYEMVKMWAALDLPARVICEKLLDEFGVKYNQNTCSSYIYTHKDEINEIKKEMQTSLNNLPFASKASRVNLIGTKIKRLMENDDKLLLDYLKAMKDEMEGFETADGKDDPLLKLADAILESRRR